jgi:hypothetical protein
MMLAFSTLRQSWLLSLIFSPSGRDKSEGAGCGSPFSAACWRLVHNGPRIHLTSLRILQSAGHAPATGARREPSI